MASSILVFVTVKFRNFRLLIKRSLCNLGVFTVIVDVVVVDKVTLQVFVKTEVTAENAAKKKHQHKLMEEE